MISIESEWEDIICHHSSMLLNSETQISRYSMISWAKEQAAQGQYFAPIYCLHLTKTASGIWQLRKLRRYTTQHRQPYKTSVLLIAKRVGTQQLAERNVINRRYRQKYRWYWSKSDSTRLRKPPGGYSKWTLRLLPNQTVELGYIDEISYVFVMRILKKRI